MTRVLLWSNTRLTYPWDGETLLGLLPRVPVTTTTAAGTRGTGTMDITREVVAMGGVVAAVEEATMEATRDEAAAHDTILEITTIMEGCTTRDISMKKRDTEAATRGTANTTPDRLRAASTIAAAHTARCVRPGGRLTRSFSRACRLESLRARLVPCQSEAIRSAETRRCITRNFRNQAREKELTQACDSIILSSRICMIWK